MSEEALKIAENGREAKGKEERERHIQLNAEFQRIERRDKKALFFFFFFKKAFLSEQCQETEENNRMGNTRFSSRNLEIPKEHFMKRWAP